MKYLIRYSSVLLCFLLLLTVFSVTASAKENIVNEHYYMMDRTITNDVYNYTSSGFFNPLDDVTDFYDPAFGDGIPTNTSYVIIKDVLSVYPYGEKPLFQKGENTNVSIYNVYCDVLISNNNGVSYFREIHNQKALILYKDGSSEYIYEDVKISLHTGFYDVTFDFVPKNDVSKIEIHTQRIKEITPVNHNTEVKLIYGESSKETTTIVVQSSEESSLLKSVIEWLKGIKDGITNVFNSIAELPSKIWSFIENGLKTLFVPDDEYITTYKDKWYSLLSSRFGAVYQVCDVVTDFVGSLTHIDGTRGIIEIPEATIPLPDNNSFTFGGNTVQIIPQGFEWLSDLISALTSGVATLLFINGLLKRYDKIIGGENN